MLLFGASRGACSAREGGQRWRTTRGINEASLYARGSGGSAPATGVPGPGPGGSAPGGRDLMWLTWIGSLAALLFALILALGVLRKSPGNSTMQDLSRAVLEGATAYLKQQYKIVGLFFALLFVVLAIISYGLQLLSPFVPFAFITGGFFSALAGFIGMSIATRANSRTAQGASESLNAGLRGGVLLGHRDGDDRGRARPARHRDLVVPAALRLQCPGGGDSAYHDHLRHGGVAAGAVRAPRRRHLHQGRGRRRRPGRQG